MSQIHFVGRLVLALVLTLALLGGANYLVFRAKLSSGFVHAGQIDVRADARSIELAYASGDAGERPFDEVSEVIDYISDRPQVTGVQLVDARGVVVASDDPDAIGEHEPENGALARSGRSFFGSEREADESKENFEYVSPLRLAGQPHALEVDEDGAALRDELDDLRRDSLLLLVVALVFALPFFFVLGGRKLVLLHGRAVRGATRDALTGLGNATEFHEELRRATALATRYREPLSVAVLDVDDFKLANDRKGHREGDRLLVRAAELLLAGRPEDRGFRIGGDEFALILPRTDADGAIERVNRIRVAAAEKLGGVTLSCGVAELDPAAPDVETMIEQADAAVYEAKRLGRDRVVSFAEVDDAQIVTGSQIRALHELLAGAPPKIAFQPIWELADEGNRILGFEALARPDTADRLAPADAFEIAERIGRAHELDALCRRATLARAHELPDDALLFLNVAPQSLDHDELAGDALVRAVRAAGLAPERVVLEITERSSGRLQRVVDGAARLRSLGFKLALDDVGAGNAGLEMLRRMPLDFVKIDREVIVDSSSGGPARAVLLAVLSFAAETGSYVIAEGIETEAMLEHVSHPGRRRPKHRGNGVQGAQGYLLGRPSTERLTGTAHVPPRLDHELART
jgi:diguanylate cyclase (GGDEF)-like protein